LNAVIAHHPGHGRRPHFAAAEAGRAVLAEGGNAVEAAIAVAATISVVYPHMNSIGGDGFWLIHRPGQPVVAIDACGRAAPKPIWRCMRACGAMARPSGGQYGGGGDLRLGQGA
jgi:gamma-glutamyltranspeptidase